MIHLVQIMQHMFNALGYSTDEVAEAFLEVYDGKLSIDELVKAVGLGPLTDNQVFRIEKILRGPSKWESCMKLIEFSGAKADLYVD